MSNESRYIRRLRDHRRMEALLSLHGIDYEAPAANQVKSPLWLNEPDKERYIITVNEMQAAPRNSIQEATARKLMRLAVRSVYYAGLDCGEVTLRMAHSGRPIVERIEPLKRVGIHEAEASSGGEERIMLGMDPEFLLISPQGKVVPASRFLSREGSVGYDNATVRGRDGVHPLVELRPEPSAQPDGLIRNLRRTMWTAASLIEDKTLQWVAGGMPIPGLPLGGHIHVSGVPLRSAFVRALDNYLALPLLMLEDQSGMLRRKRYGKLGDIRTKSYGGFEYRTLPSMLVSPRITKGAVALTKLIAGNADRLTSRPLDELSVLKAYYAGDKEWLRPIVARIWAELEALPDYAQFATYLDPLSDWIAICRSWNEENDFRPAWRIPPFN